MDEKAGTKRGQRILREQPKSSRADWIRGVLADRHETVEQFLARPLSWRSHETCTSLVPGS